jgi:hypothetical protein
MRVRLSRGCPWWLYICSQLWFTSNSYLLLQVEVLGLAGFVYPSSGLLPWQESGRPISRNEGSYPRHHFYRRQFKSYKIVDITFQGKDVTILFIN